MATQPGWRHRQGELMLQRGERRADLGDELHRQLFEARPAKTRVRRIPACGVAVTFVDRESQMLLEGPRPIHSTC